MLGVAVEAMNMIGAEARGHCGNRYYEPARDTAIVWDKETPESRSIMQSYGSAAGHLSIVTALKEKGLTDKFRDKTGLVIDAYFSGTKVKWILDNVPGARERAERETSFRHSGDLADLETDQGCSSCDGLFQRIPHHAV